MLTSSHVIGTRHTDCWGSLQRPRPSTAVEPQLLLLLSAIDAGWRVEEPVYLRSRMGERSRRAYHVILHRPGHVVNLMTLPQTPEVEAFVQREGWQVLTAGY